MRSISLLAAASVLGLGAVASAATPDKAVAILKPAAGGKVAGTIGFAKVDGGVRVSGKVTGLTPGSHGFHVHEKGDCSAADFTSAGGHFNPTGDPHAAPTEAKRHAGDMGNIEADKDGVADINYVDSKLSFDGATSVVGKGVIVHEKADDMKTQPTGAAGARVACGVVEGVQ
jgi:superoxide dismutase, Cu-Zn family